MGNPIIQTGIARKFKKKLRVFTESQTARDPKSINLTDIQGVYNIGSPGEPQPLYIHKRDLVVLPQNGSINVTLFFKEFPELQEMMLRARDIRYMGITIQSAGIVGEVQFMVNMLGFDENGEKSGQIIDGGITNFGANLSNTNRAWTSPVTNKSIAHSGGKVLETNAGVQEFTDFNLSEIDVKFIETANNILGFGITNWWVHFLLWF